MKKQAQIPPSFFTKYKTPLLIGGAVVVVAGIGITYYVMSKKKQKEKEENPTYSEVSVDIPVPPSRYTPPISSSPTRVPLPTRSGTKSIIKYGSRGNNVKILQRYLKIFKENLGRSGVKRDGVDGIFGRKTAAAAKKRLGKTVFTYADITKMNKALKIIGK